ncbi:MAG: sigma-70 family RNA polymerase sigma factor [Bacteroidales bacterium]
MDKAKKEIATLFENHADYLYNYAISRVNDEYTAEDLVQETFISALKSYGSFEGKSKASTWLIAILKNKIIDLYRKRAREFQKENLDDISSSETYFNSKGGWIKDMRPQPWKVDTNSGTEKEEFYTILQNCLTKLKEIQRMAFVMKHMDDMDTSDICKELDITASNYWVIIHRAKLQLRTCMETNWINA